MTLRQKNDVFIVIVRHTPAFAFVHRFAIGTATGSSFSPLREGMARQRFVDNQNDAAAHPLSERGAAKRRGVSHCQIGYPSNPVNPWSLIQLWSAIQ